VVAYDRIELGSDEDCRRELGLALTDVRLPVVELPDGSSMSAPSLRELADRLGWVTQPKLREYDLSIYGAGPAGLSAAVYAALGQKTLQMRPGRRKGVGEGGVQRLP